MWSDLSPWSGRVERVFTMSVEKKIDLRRSLYLCRWWQGTRQAKDDAVKATVGVHGTVTREVEFVTFQVRRM